jgi:dTDP-4-amino-4,6-dideoxygalactose transaminase
MDKNKRIQFNKPYIIGKELEYIAQAVHENHHISGSGPFTHRCQEILEKSIGCFRALLTHSCTAALEIAAILCDIQPGDEIVMPSFTFVSTANPFVLRGGIPVFVDIRPDTLNLDERLIASAITDKTKAIVPVHYGGMPCAMDEIMDTAQKNNLLVVEDAAQTYLSRYKDRPLGSIGHLGCLSFHETKNIICGEGGALLVNDERFAHRAEIIWEKGTDRSRFLRGDIDKYSWQDIGSSYMPSDMIGAFLLAQLEEAEKIIVSRSKTFHHYYRELKDLEDRGLIRLPHHQDGSTGNGHLFFILARNKDDYRKLMKHLSSSNIQAVPHYVPLHSSKAGLKFAKVSGSMKVTEDVSQRLIRLPLFYGMEEEEVERIVKVIYNFYAG